MEDAPTPTPAADLPPPAARRAASRRKYGRRLARWVGELVTVFVGVYAAFTLNNYQAHRQERRRREQILDWAQAEYSETLAGITTSQAHFRKEADEFDQGIKAGQTPPLYAFNFRSDYNPTDFTSMLQSGGFDVLEIETVRDIREVEGSLRQLVDISRHDQQLSDALILPNLDKPPSFFYDPATRQLRPSYAWYPNYFKTESEIFADMRPEIIRVLARLRIERERNR